MRTKRWAIACTVVAMTALAACGESGETGTPETEAAPGESSAAPEEIQETFKIGVYGPEQIPQGVDIRDGAMLAAEEINAAGEGPEIEIVFCDSEALPQRAIECTTKFAQEDQVQAIAGGFSSAETLAMLDTVVDAQLPYVSSGAASPDVTAGVDSTGDRKYIFRIGPVNSTSLAADMCLTYSTSLKALGYERFGILFEDAAFAIPLVEFLADCLPNPSEATGGLIPVTDGVQVVAQERHTPNATDFTSQFAAFEAADAQFVIEVNATQVGIAVGRSWGELQPDFMLGGINVSGQASNYFEATNMSTVGQLNGPAGIVRAPVSEKTIPFFDAFTAAFDRDPIYNGAATYDAIYTLHEAAIEAGSLEADALVTALEATDRIGVQGVESFDETHDVVYSPTDPSMGLSLLYFQFREDGTKEVVFPDTLAGDNEFMAPAFATP